MNVSRYVSKMGVSETCALASQSLNTGPCVSAASSTMTYAYSIHLVERLSTSTTFGITDKSSRTVHLCRQVVVTRRNAIDMLM